MNYKADGGTIHKGEPSRVPGRFVAQCNGRTQRGEPTAEPVTCKRCGG